MSRHQRGPGRQGRFLEKPKSMKIAFKQLQSYIRPYRLLFILIILLASLSAVFSILGPRLLGLITNEVQIGIFDGLGINFTKVFTIMWSLVALYLLSYLFNVLQGLISTRVTQRITKTMRSDIFLKMDRLPLKYFDQTPYGDTLSRMTNDVDLISQTVNSSITQIFTSVTLLVGVLVMMFVVSWQLALVSLIGVP
ncbi:MAG: ABC transporter transmembrane domain-containing protein, partial [Acholeplasmataceae bacterium]|nr:ABC transporter transmembrane domain-containing protein [Acholeplasmataceae bacterium]